jgi:hypothetical protein
MPKGGKAYPAGSSVNQFIGLLLYLIKLDAKNIKMGFFKIFLNSLTSLVSFSNKLAK